MKKMSECVRCGRCCIRSPCQIPVMHIDALRYVLVNEFGKPKQINGLDIVEALFSYHEEVLLDGRVAGSFSPLARTKTRCMWLVKKNGQYNCKLFWNKTTKILVGFAEQVVSKGKGCTLDNSKQVPVIPMVFRNHERYILNEKRTIKIPMKR